MEFDAEAVEAEVRAAFDGYEAALGANDVDALTGYFWDSPKAVRLMTEGGLYGIVAIAAFRRGRDVSDIARSLTRIDIVALGPHVAVAPAEYRRIGSGPSATMSIRVSDRAMSETSRPRRKAAIAAMP